MTEKYNGWANYETWNIALWLQNDEGLYQHAKQYKRTKYPYLNLVANLESAGINETPDGVKYRENTLDRNALNQLIRSL